MRFKKGLTLAAASAMALTAVTGCAGARKVSESKFPTTVGATYGDEKIYLDELFFYARLEQSSYDATYDWLAGYGFITYSLDEYYKKIYDEDNNLTTWNVVRQSAVRLAQQTRVLRDYAKEHDITLSEEDIKKVEEEVGCFTTGEEAYLFADTCVTEELIKQILTDNALANRAHEKLCEGYDPTINKADYRVARGYYFLIPKDKYDDTDEEQRANDVLAAVKAAYAEKEKKIEDVDFNAIADQFTDKEKTAETPTNEAGETVEATEAATQEAKEEQHLIKVYGYKDEAITIGGSDSKLASVASYLPVGTFAKADDDQYYYIVYVSEPTDEKSTQSKIDQAISDRKEEKFKENYAEVLKNAPELKVKDAVLDLNLVFTEIQYPETTTAEPESEEPTTEEGTEKVTTAEATTAEVTTEEATTEEVTTEEAPTAEEVTEDASAEETNAEEATTEEAPSEEEATVEDTVAAQE